MEKDKRLETEINKRRTFAIISHPDAGKTTLTEKLLYLGGAIRSTGTVKSRKSAKFATSDWMEIEKQRGISVTSSVMQFSYQDHYINILDTPGHEDFSEDTYRTLLAVDSVVMIIDAAKGVEAQTKKLFKVCSDQGIPIFTFVNKMDRNGREPLELLEEIEEVLGIESYPMNWPLGMGQNFKGVYDRQLEQIEFYETKDKEQMLKLEKINNLNIEKVIGKEMFSQLHEEISLLNEAGNTYKKDAIQQGKQTPVFFGSAITSFGVPSFLDHFIRLAPPPSSRESSKGIVKPDKEIFSGFVFKIQANMNPAHRDRIAFLRVCSGKFEKGMEAWLERTNKSMKLSQGQQFFASERGNIDIAYPGDIVGLYDPGTYQIGDTLCGSKDTFSYGDLPQFSPEHFAKVRAKKALKQKHFHKGIKQLSEEGAVQVYRTAKWDETVLGVVGMLQFEIFEYRMKHEYGVEIQFDSLPHQYARWTSSEDIESKTKGSSNLLLVYDQNELPVILFENNFALRWFKDKNPDVQLRESR
ncbi:peptide chain release factor 3 [Pseudalkalibacillus caeni]|uniref:Peptide chain release factor 3 n=1 Tax=Exobacillus caeni TaxID=2574798 RepID=A0A5R9F0H5_9BACL|nr:peptide chain release factor 3 [Pseudalkalibacillus caeni]TLS37037.1 peptide chain release factor 3 [Pseudalkalibacillus caeni]